MKNKKNTCLEKSKNQFSLLMILFLALPFIMVSCDLIEDIVDEYEPNNKLSEAYAIALDTKYNANISEETDDDWFKITPSHGSDTYDKVQISVTNVSADLKIRLELYDASGKSLESHGATTGGQTLTFTFATPGVEYYVRFSGWDGFTDHRSTGSYSFTVSNMNANDEFAPNHTIETAEESLEYGISYNGVLVSKYEDDYYKFTNPTPNAWNSYTFALTNVSEDLKVRIRLYGTNKSELDSKGSSTAGADLSYTFISKEDVIYLQVLGWDGFTDHRSSGNYTLTVSAENPNDEFAPNHTIETAKPLEFGRSYNGIIVSREEDDYYKFTNPTPGVWNSYTFNLTNVSSSLKVKIYLYGADKSKLYSTGATTAGGNLSYTFVSKENEFYLQVLGWDGFTDHRSTGSYTLTPVVNGNDDYEPDDTFEQAREIKSFPRNLTGKILATAANNNDGDYEFFKVTITNNKKVLWSITPEASNTELHFDVYDKNKTHLGGADGSRGQTITGSMNNTTGTDSFIYIKLGGYVGDNGNYTISFTETDAT